MTANGSVVKNGDVLTGSQELRIYGVDLESANFALYFNNIQYTPLFKGDGYLGYILGDNGVVNIVVNGSVQMSFTVSGIVVPDVFPTTIIMALKAEDSLSSVGDVDKVTFQGKCLNYPHKSTEALPYFRMSLMLSEDISEDDFQYVNCSINNTQWNGTINYRIWNFSVLNADEPAYVIYNGFIFAVFNYDNN